MDDTIPTRLTMEQADAIAAALLADEDTGTLAGRIVIELLRAETGGYRAGQARADEQWLRAAGHDAQAQRRDRR